MPERHPGWRVEGGFDLEGFLSQPLVARVAAAGPTIRPVWFLWEEEAFWWITGGWSRLPSILEHDPDVALVVDTCDLETGAVKQVNVRGRAEVVPFDPDRARRKLVRYLGPDDSRWDPEFREGTFDDPTARLVRLVPERLVARDLSYELRGGP